MLKKIKITAKHWMANHKNKFSGDRSTKRLTMCKKCYTFYYKNSWHFEKPTYMNEYREEEVPVLFTQCPTCLEQEDILYEREVNLISEMGMNEAIV